MKWRRRLELLSVLSVIGAGLCALLPLSPAARPQSSQRPAAEAAESLGRPVRVGRLAHPAIRESSGIVASRRYRGVYWTMNDSSNPPQLFAINAAGELLRAVRLVGAENVDWEDIAADGSGKLYVADVGDNRRKRQVLTIYVLGEPDPRGTAAAAVEETCRFRYPRGHGPFDCEAMFVRKGWAYLITKQSLEARVYRVRLDGQAGQTAEAEYLGLLPEAAWVTAADISPDGRHIAVLSYTGVYVYDLPQAMEELVAAGTTSREAAPVQAVRVRPRKRTAALGQAEAICWTDGAPAADLLITNEHRQVFRLRSARPKQPTSAVQR